MAKGVKFPDIVRHENPAYPIVDSNDVRGLNIYAVNFSDVDLSEISGPRRTVGHILSCTNAMYQYVGEDTSDAKWNNKDNWRCVQTSTEGGFSYIKVVNTTIEVKNGYGSSDPFIACAETQGIYKYVSDATPYINEYGDDGNRILETREGGNTRYVDIHLILNSSDYYLLKRNNLSDVDDRQAAIDNLCIDETVESGQFLYYDGTHMSFKSLPDIMTIKGRVDTVEELYELTDVSVGDVYLVGLEGSETFEEYVCTKVDESTWEPTWEGLGPATFIQKQVDWNENDSTKEEYVKNRTHWREFINHNDILCDSNAEVSYYNQYTSIAIVTWIGEPIQSREELDHLIIRYNGIEILHRTTTYQSPTRWWVSDNYNTFGIGFGVAPGYHYELYGGYVGETLPFEVKSIWTETVYHKIDERYIPDTIARQSAVDTLIGSLDSTVGIASIQDDIVTLKQGIVQTDGLVENNSEQDIELAKVAKTGSYGDLVDKLFVKENTSNLTQAMQPNTLYTWTNTLTSSDILAPSLVTPTNTNIIAEYMGKFTTGATVPTLNFPDNIVWQTGLPTLQPLYTYEFSIMDNIGIFSPMGYVTESDVQTMINANKLKWTVIN